jgi:hypothetical protein
VSDAVGGYVDRTFQDQGAYYLRLSNVARAELGFAWNHSEIAAAYSFRLIPDTATESVAPFHAADLRYAYATPRFIFLLSDSFGIGDQVFDGVPRLSALNALAPPAANNIAGPTTPVLATPATIDNTVLPSRQTLPFVTDRAIAAVSYRIDRRLQLTTQAGYLIYGGLDRDARRYLTLQQIADGSVSVAYAASSRVTLLTSLLGAHGWNSLHDDYVILTVSETLNYRWTRATNVSAGLGVSSSVTDSPARQAKLGNTPVGSLGVAHTLRARDVIGTLSATLAYVPLVDAISGRVQNRLLGTGVASVASGNVRAGINLGMSQVVPTDDPDAVTVLSASLFSGYQFLPWLGASLGAQVTRQHFTSTQLALALPTASGVAWGVYAGLFAVSPTWRF